MSILDTGRREAEHSLYMVPARSKAAAVASLKAGKAYGKELLHRTPLRDVWARRREWQNQAREAAAETQNRPGA